MKSSSDKEPERTGTADKRIPVTLLTGFLGSGKTTLLNNLLTHPEMAGAAVLINEFGEVGIDHHLVNRVDETMMILDSGCICCSVQGDLVRALRNLAERSSKREIPPVSRVIIETTGLADPVPVVYTLTQEPFVAARYQCDGVVTAVDATHALKQLDLHREAVRQVAMADRLLITKCDLAGDDCRALLEQRLELLNPGAPRIEVRHGLVSPEALRGCGIYTTAGKSPDVAAWLGAEQAAATKSHPARRSGATSGWGGKGMLRVSRTAASVPNGRERHDDLVTSFVVEFDQAVPWYGFSVAMGRVLERHGASILRVKGLMNIAGDPLPRVIHCVQDVAYPPVTMAKWPKQSPFEDGRGRLVFIVRDLSGAQVGEIRRGLLGARNTAGTRASLAVCPIPTRCWLSHSLSRSAPSVLDVEGWVVQGIRLGQSKQAVSACF